MAAAIDRPGSVPPRLPGEMGIWMFIIGDLVIFSLLFSVFVYDRAGDVALYVESQRELNQNYGLFNTLLMLTSSWFVALGIHNARYHRFKFSSRCIVAAFLCGSGFITVKYFEYSEKFRAGFTVETNDFYMYYFVMTAIHLLHVIIGMGVLLYLWKLLQAPGFADDQINAMESGASFWHLVDVLWIVLFALLYLMR